MIDPNLEIPLESRLLRIPPETLVVTRDPEGLPQRQKDKAVYLLKTGARILSYKGSLDLCWLMDRLGESGITSILTEGGSSLNAHLLEEGVVDKALFFIAPKILGGRDSIPSVGGKMPRRLEDAFKLRDVKVRRLGEDMLVEGYL